MITRRELRERREFLYQKSQEEKERTTNERKHKMRDVLENNAIVSNELKTDQEMLRHSVEMDDDKTRIGSTHIDSEYASAGTIDPLICISTSRDPSSRLKEFVKELRIIIPNSQTMNRGNYTVSNLVDSCKRNNVSDIIIAQETRGVVDGLIICHLPLGPTAYFNISGCVSRHDVNEKDPISGAYPHIIIDGFSTQIGKRTSDVLKFLFPVPKSSSSRIITFANRDDYVSFRHHSFNPDDDDDVALKELGPRFEMKLYQIKLGTIDQVNADVEWCLRPFMNSSKKRRFM